MLYSLTAGSQHTCGLNTSGAAFCWGQNELGQLGDNTTTPSLTPISASTSLVSLFASLAAGSKHTCGLSTSGEAFCWGYNSFGQVGDGTTRQRLTPVAVNKSLVSQFANGSLAAGSQHTCGLATSGAAFCWGDNGSGQLGDGTRNNQRLTPVAVNASLVSQFANRSLVAGYSHTCGLTTSGLAFCWGYNSFGQLGDGTRNQRLTPVAVSTSLVSQFASGTLVAGLYHTCGLAMSGAAYCWGDNSFGQLGDGTMIQKLAPVAVSTSSVSQFISGSLVAGDYYTCGLAMSGAAYCWGDNRYGQLGDRTKTQRLTPVAVGTSLVSQFISGSLVAGSYHTCGLNASGVPVCWGNNFNGQLGNGFASFGLAPNPVATRTLFTSGSLVAGYDYTCGMNLSASVAAALLCWGFNDDTMLTPALISTPLVSQFATGSLAAGYQHTCVLNTAGAAFCRGVNSYGQLGDGTTNSSDALVAVSTSLVSQFAIGSLVAAFQHTCGLSTAGTAYCWGDNSFGQLGDGSVDQKLEPVAISTSIVSHFASGSLVVGEFHTCGLSTSGTAFCWGDNTYGQLGDGTTTQRDTPVAVSRSLVPQFASGSLVAGDYHTCGLTTSGEAFCWGDNTYGQLGDGTTTQREAPVAVSTSLVSQFASGSLVAGYQHTCGLSPSGEAFCWGGNAYGQLGDVTMIQRLTPVAVSTSRVSEFASGSLAAGFQHTCGLSASGAGFCWGDNTFGQLGLGVRLFESLPVRVVMPLPAASVQSTPSMSQTLSKTQSQSPTRVSSSLTPSCSPSAISTASRTASLTPSRSVTQTKSRSPSQTSSGFPLQLVFDNTQHAISDIDPNSYYIVSASSSYGFVWHFPETDAACGPVAYRLKVLVLALSAVSVTSPVTFNVSLAAYDAVNDAILSTVATTSVVVMLSTMASYSSIVLPASFICNTVSFRFDFFTTGLNRTICR